jgi:hypothetical protein
LADEFGSVDAKVVIVLRPEPGHGTALRLDDFAGIFGSALDDRQKGSSGFPPTTKIFAPPCAMAPLAARPRAAVVIEAAAMRVKWVMIFSSQLSPFVNFI